MMTPDKKFQDANSEAERRLLSSMMVWNSAADEVLEKLTVDDFWTPSHRGVFAAISTLRQANSPCDVAAVFQEMTRNRSGFYEIGEKFADWLADLSLLEPTGSNARYFTSLVQNASLVRTVRNVAFELIQQTDGTVPGAELLADAEKQLFAIAERFTTGKGIRVMPDIVAAALVRIDERYTNKGQMDGIPTGYYELDNLIAGMRPGQLFILGARPSVGKSALGLCTAMNVAEAGYPVLFFSLEMPEADLADRMLATRSDVAMHRLKSGRIDNQDVASLASAGDTLSKMKLYLDESTSRTCSQISAITRRAIRKHGVKLVVVDYLQLIGYEDSREKNRNVIVGANARRLFHMARECNIPVLALAQLNRGVEDRNEGRPRLSDLRESGEIEQHANTVILMNRAQNVTDDMVVWDIEVNVAKNRNGPTGDTKLQYRRGLMRFENAAVGH
jgi:replicative DNA helicase